MAELVAATIEWFATTIGTEMTLTASQILGASYAITTLAAVACTGPVVRRAVQRDELRPAPDAGGLIPLPTST